MIKELQHYAGNYLEIDFVPYKLTPIRGRHKKYRPSSEAQKILNQKNREREAYFLIHENFTAEDYTIHPTYAECYRPQSSAEALRDRRNFILRLKRLYKKHNVEFKCFAVLEQAERSKRFHHHMIISGKVPMNEIEKAWGMGYCNPRHLEFTEKGIVGLACYIVKSAYEFEDEAENTKCTFKAYSCTRNLRRPSPPRERPIKHSVFTKLYEDCFNRQRFEEIYKDYFYVEAQPRETEFGERYLTVRMCRRDAKLSFITDSDYSGLNYERPRLRRRAKAPPG